MFIVCCIGVNEEPPDVPQNTIDEFNKMHAIYKVHGEWDIGGLKQKSRSMKHFNATKPKYTKLFRSCAFLITFFTED